MASSTQSFVDHFGASLIALYRYGRQELTRSRADELHLLMVISSSQSLAGYKPPFIHKIQSLQVFTQDELIRSLDVFPLEFLDMKMDRELVAGTDILDQLSVSVDNVRHQAEFGLRTSLLRLRHAALLTPKQQASAALFSASDVIRCLRGLLNTLRGLALRSSEDVIAAVEEWTSLSFPNLTALQRSERPSLSDYTAYRSEIEQLIDRIDHL
ncbi:hypothetical protein EBR57_03025 [bacterium]|nr:hypothetical protein [bacterium]